MTKNAMLPYEFRYIHIKVVQKNIFFFNLKRSLIFSKHKSMNEV